LKENGLTTNDVSIVNLPAPDHRTALESGSVEAIATWEPWYSTLEDAKAIKPLVDSSKGAKRYLSVIVTRNDFAQRYPDIVERFLKVNEKAADFIRNNPAEAAEIIAKESKLPLVAFARVVKTTDWDSTITPADLDAFQKVKVFLQDTKVLKKEFDLAELFDDRYLKKLKK
jgi:sulfonate transport system substrate-binding protein